MRRVNGSVEEARVVVGAVSPAPVVLTQKDFGSANDLSADAIAEIGRKAAAAVDPIDDLRGPADYKRHLVNVLVRRALSECVAS